MSNPLVFRKGLWALLAVALLTVTVPERRRATFAAPLHARVVESATADGPAGDSARPGRAAGEAPQTPAQVFLSWDYDFTRIPGCTAGQQACIYEFQVLRITEAGETLLTTYPAPMGATGLFLNMQVSLPAPGMGLTSYGVRALARDAAGMTVSGALAAVDYRFAPAAPENLRVQ